jgi:hypothetical protein
MRKLFIVLAFSLACAGSWSDELIAYRVKKGAQTSSYSIRILRLDKGYSVSSIERDGEEERIAMTDPSFFCSSFSFRNTSAGTEYLALREAGKIVVSGKLKGKPLQREFRVNENPWIQNIEYAFQNSPAFQKGRFRFWFINADECELFEMEATKEASETIDLAGKPVSAQRVKVALTGIAALFWQAGYWFRAGDNRYVRYETTEGPGGAKITIELDSISEIRG